MKGVIQIGAHYAEEYEYWKSLGVENFIFFEPVMANFVKMSSILPVSDKIRVFRLALGNFYGKAMINIETEHNGKSCSILTPTGHLKQYPDIVFNKKEMVPVNRLDNIVYDRTDYDHLHIDTQGYELEVLKGAEESLRYINTIEVEVYRKELYEGCAMFKDVVEFLFDRDFSIESVEWRGNTWGNACFRKLPKV